MVCFEFMSGDVNVPFGTLHVVLTRRSSRRRRLAPSLRVPRICMGWAITLRRAGPGGHRNRQARVRRPHHSRGVRVAIPFIMDRQTELHTYEERLTLAYTSSAALRQLRSGSAAAQRDFTATASTSWPKRLKRWPTALTRTRSCCHSASRCSRQTRGHLRRRIQLLPDATANLARQTPERNPQAESPQLGPAHLSYALVMRRLLRLHRRQGPAFQLDEAPGVHYQRPQKWFQRWGRFLLLSIKILCVTAKVAATGMGGLGNLIPADFVILSTRRCRYWTLRRRDDRFDDRG